MKKNIRDYKVNGQQYSYILDCISDVDNWNNEEDWNEDKEKVRFFFNCFEEEYNYDYNKRKYPNLADRIGSYIQCDPSCISVIHYYNEIAELGKSWGYFQTPKKEEKFVTEYYHYLGIRLVQLKEHFGL